MTAKHAHELEAAGETRWSARIDEGQLVVKDNASGEEVAASAYTLEGETVLFALPGENGLRRLEAGAPGAEAFRKVVEKLSAGPAPAKAASKPATEKRVPA